MIIAPSTLICGVRGTAPCQELGKGGHVDKKSGQFLGSDRGSFISGFKSLALFDIFL
jgi:hypothetical protein